MDGDMDEQAGSEREAAGVVRVRGAATPEEVAAVVAVLSAASGGGRADDAPPRSRWAAPAAALRHPLEHAPGAWQRTFRG